MALEISEFAERHSDRFGEVAVFARPASAVQSVAISAGSSASASFMGASRYLRLVASADCRIAFGAAPVASAASEFFPAGEHVVGIAGGTKLAVIAA